MSAQELKLLDVGVATLEGAIFESTLGIRSLGPQERLTRTPAPLPIRIR